MVVNYGVIGLACAACAWYFKPIGIDGNKELLEENYKEDLSAIRENNRKIQEFLRKQQEGDEELNARMDQVLRSGNRKRVVVPRSGGERNVAVGLGSPP